MLRPHSFPTILMSDPVLPAIAGLDLGPWVMMDIQQMEHIIAS